ncbi:TraB/VirB10 family protein [Alteromonas macleodii]|uniref:Bacterial conjugation TrbI-like family protein n=1 Tax=Alteromonas macleodii TaxID=28108 RepID=A0AB36FNE4_ALTMA|nr:TraB/VirB10 family protein [Alteromonas macleodii]OES24215.1 bacterial conjugation TrbI-like family protein [Alteromonas macleodii]OES24846.1 bacterial conjugation TrbI-like family protein [Alteromonas macleodii]OES25124.1 bacterial conjugation TrbI-like family protein [Alteromonas macleodii]OES39166.1 bacterial conjugation TrbI-like family protein [Alteromonas macleodii]
MEKLRIWFQNQDPDKRQKVIKFSVIGIVVVIVLGYYFLGGEGEKRELEQQAALEAAETEEALDSFDLLADDVSQTFDNQFESQNQAIDSAVSTAEQSAAEVSQMKRQLDQILEALNNQSAAPQTSSQSTPFIEIPPEQQQGYVPPQAFRNLDEPTFEEPTQIIGTIGRIQGTRQPAEKKTEAQEKYFLPMSFAKAQSLHGLRIVTTEGAMADPEQLLIRIQAPNILPNSIRSDLEGCFLMSSATAHLAKRRVDPQLVMLSCLDKDGNSVIEEEVQGYVVDSDGNKGMSANIVSEMSDFIWRALLTGTVGGIGEGVSLAGVQNSITGGGQVQTFDPDRISQSALGNGLKNGSEAIQEIFIDLAKQHAPVAEVGNSKQIMVVFQKGVWLHIKPRYERTVIASAN